MRSKVPVSLLKRRTIGRRRRIRVPQAGRSMYTVADKAFMDLKLSQDELEFRDELRSWLAVNAPRDWDEHRDEPLEARFDFLKRSQRKLYDAGWAGVSWPKEY